MLIFLRRFLVLVGLMFWLGGFTFYAAIVVPVGQEVLGSHLQQGMITQRVTNYLNLAGAIALLPLGWDAARARDTSAPRRLLRRLSWATMAALLVALLWLHPRLDALLDVDAFRLIDARSFRMQHRWYLWLSTLQWACGSIYAALSLAAWRVEDQMAAKIEENNSTGA
jgi:hypothetical protein